MNKLEKYMGRELSNRDYILMIALVFVFFIGLKLLFKAIHSPAQTLTEAKATRIMADNNPVRGNCGVGFYFFQVEAYSFCYPDTLTPYITLAAESKSDITFDDKKGNQQMVVVPDYSKDGKDIYDSCLIKETSYVSGKEWVREKRRFNNKENCEEILSISTTIPTENATPFWISYQNIDGQDEAEFVNTYMEIEKSVIVR